MPLRTVENGTSLERIREKTIYGINNLQEQVGVPFEISGGTEDGHTGGLTPNGLTHGNGYKLDIRFQDGVKEKINEYLATNCPSDGKTTSLGKLYEFNNGDYHYKILEEDDHFDICIT
jgi:hypothetical protein